MAIVFSMIFCIDFRWNRLESCCGSGPARCRFSPPLFCNDLFSKCCCGPCFFIEISLPWSVAIVFAMLFSSIFYGIVLWLWSCSFSLFPPCFVTNSSRNVAVANAFSSKYRSPAVWRSFSRCFFHRFAFAIFSWLHFPLDMCFRFDCSSTSSYDRHVP